MLNKKVIKMPSIGQFSDVILHITKAARFDGLDDSGEPTYNTNLLPILKAKGTVKLHGTNASVCYNPEHGFWFQSKKNIITPEKDNAGFAFWANQNKDIFIEFIKIIREYHSIIIYDNTITIYGEWAGKGIQKNVGISELDKSFYIFGIKITPNDSELDAYWVNSNIFNLTQYENIYHIEDFKTFEIEIDFNNPLMSQNQMVEMVQEVEEECPVAKHFGVSGIGEGIVFEVMFKDTIRWKMKGDKHAGKSKVKVAKKVDDVKLQKINEVVDAVTPEWRLEQMYQETFDTLNGGKGSIKGTGDFIRNLIKDILKEDCEIINNANLSPKDINSNISKKARIWLMKTLNTEAGL